LCGVLLLGLTFLLGLMVAILQHALNLSNEFLTAGGTGVTMTMAGIATTTKKILTLW
jgi:hypothetical protein